MRTFTDPSTMSIKYPENQVFSGDLNLIEITKNTTSTHIELSYYIGSYLYKENLFFLTNDISFSMAGILQLIFNRDTVNQFNTISNFTFTVKLYNNTSLLDEQDFAIEDVILGKRRVFDKFGVVPNPLIIDYDPSIGLNTFYYFFPYTTRVYVKIVGGSEEVIGVFSGLAFIDLSEVVGEIESVYYLVLNYLKNSNLQYLDGANFWTTDEYEICESSFGITPADEMALTIPDISCSNIFSVDYTGGTFTPDKTYKVTIVVDSVTNPNEDEQILWFSLGGVDGVNFTGPGEFSDTIICGSTGILKLNCAFSADSEITEPLGLIISSIVLEDESETFISLNEDCIGNGKKIGLRFLNRFGLWKNYYVIQKNENIASSKGVSLWYSDSNYSELNNLFSEENKQYSQSINVFREGLNKEQANDFSDIIYTDYVHLYDEINAVWIPIKVNTNTFLISEKENLFDVSLNLLLQSNNE